MSWVYKSFELHFFLEKAYKRVAILFNYMKGDIKFEKVTIENIAMCNGCGKPVGNNPVRVVLNNIPLDRIYCNAACGRKNYFCSPAQDSNRGGEFPTPSVYY